MIVYIITGLLVVKSGCLSLAEVAPPKLNVTAEYIDVPPNTSLFLQCNGIYPLVWDFRYQIEEKKILKPTNEWKSGGAEAEVFISVISLDLRNYTNSGRYRCMYKSEEDQRSASLYVFVNDSESLLLPIDWVPITEDKMDVIPCLATNSEVIVTLRKNECPGEAVPTNYVSYNRTEGFITHNSTRYFNGEFCCTAEFGNRTETQNVSLDFLEKTNHVPQVRLEATGASYVEVNSSLTLKCSILVEDHALIDVKWSPDRTRDERVKLRELKRIHGWNKETEQFILYEQEFTLNNIEEKDGGVYTCTAFDHSHRTNSSPVEVFVYDCQKPIAVEFINVTNLELPLLVDKGETVNLDVHFKANPAPCRNINLIWKKDGTVITGKIGKYEISRTNQVEVLIIHDFSSNDAGTYTLVRDTSEGEKSFTVRLKIKDKPTTTILPSNRCCYMVGQEHLLQCIVHGVPKPNAAWMWKSLNTTEYSPVDITNFEKGRQILTNAVNVSEIMWSSNDTVILNLFVKAEVSGKYLCQANNEKGETSSSSDFIVTDVNNGFDITSETLSPDEFSFFSLTCSASKVQYENVNWSVPFKNDSTMTSTYIIHYDTTQYSTLVKLTFAEVTRYDSGKYNCHAVCNGNIKTKSVTVDVRVSGVLPEKSDIVQTAVSVVAVLGGISTMVLLFLLTKKIYRHKANVQLFYMKAFQEGQMSLYNPDIPIDEQAEILPYDEKWEFSKEKLKLGAVLGQGAFGRVVKAEAVGLNDNEEQTVVAVKMLKERANASQLKSLMAELKILIHLGHHVNILNLLGAVTKGIPKGELMVLVEYCRHGNLRDYLLKHRDKFVLQENLTSVAIESVERHLYLPSVSTSNVTDDSNCSSLCLLQTSQASISAVSNRNYDSGCSAWSMSFTSDVKEQVITTADVICYSFQCARGMDYLASKKLIHRDLAARNVLLSDNNIVKICDFGLSKDCYRDSNYVKQGDDPLPLKWMALESLEDRVFTTKSDVWSYGILLWEFFTLGGNPYPGIAIDENFCAKLRTGYRMQKPVLSPNIIYQIMRSCWNADPENRPDFIQLSNAFGELLEPGIKQHFIDLNEPYVDMNQCAVSDIYINMTKNDTSKAVEANPKRSASTDDYDAVPPVRYEAGENNPSSPMEIVPMIYFGDVSA